MACSKPNEPSLNLLLNCALCNGNLANKQPKSLPCLHTFCTPCLTNEQQRFEPNANTFKCPVCNTSVKRSSEESEISNNLELDGVIEKLLYVRNLQGSERRCEMCPGEEGVVSNHWCLDCGKFLCESCLVSHSKLRPMDKVINLIGGADDVKVFIILPTKCSKHEKKLEMFCIQCKNCMCSTCVLEHHFDNREGAFQVKNGTQAQENDYGHWVYHDNPQMNCVLTPIEIEAQKTKVEGQQLLDQISSYLEEQRKHIESMEAEINTVNSQSKETGAKIWEQTEEMIGKLKEKASSLVAELETKTTNEADEILTRIKPKQDNIKKMEMIKISISQLLLHFDDANILLNFPRLKSKTTDLFNTRSTGQHGPPRAESNFNDMYEQIRQILASKG